MGWGCPQARSKIPGTVELPSIIGIALTIRRPAGRVGARIRTAVGSIRERGRRGGVTYELGRARPIAGRVQRVGEPEVLGAAAGLSEHEFGQPVSGSHESVRMTLYHVVRV